VGERQQELLAISRSAYEAADDAIFFVKLEMEGLSFATG